MRILSLFLLLASTSVSTSAMASPEEEIARRILDREAELLERIRAKDPRRHEQLLALKSTDRRMYVGALIRIARGLERDARAPSPALAAAIARVEAIQAAHPNGFDGLSAKERAAVSAELSTVAEEIFRLRQAERRERIEALRKDLGELEADVARRDRDKNALIEHFVEGVLHGRSDL